jgi:hypothetical protein
MVELGFRVVGAGGRVEPEEVWGWWCRQSPRQPVSGRGVQEGEGDMGGRRRSWGWGEGRGEEKEEEEMGHVAGRRH